MLSDFTNIKRNGKIAMKLDEGDSLISVHPCNPDDQIMMATRNGKAIQYNLNDVRVFRGRNSTGVRGIRLLNDDEVVSMSVINDPEPVYSGCHRKWLWQTQQGQRLSRHQPGRAGRRQYPDIRP